MNDLVSIITPAYNSAKLIGYTIESVQQQTYKNWELLIVIDSGTIDNTKEVVASYSQKDPRIKLLQVQIGKGIGVARNHGFQSAKGRYLAFVDADDIWLPEKLEKQLKFMVEKNAAFTCHSFSRMNADGSEIIKTIHVPERITYPDLLKNNMIGCISVILDQSKTGPLKMENVVGEDYVAWLHLLRTGFACYGLDEDLARYRILPGSASFDKKKMIIARWKIYREFEGLSFLYSLYLITWYGITGILKIN